MGSVFATGGATSSGAAYIFRQDNGGANNWGEIKKLVASDGARGDAFGSGVAIDGNTVIVGSDGDDQPGLDGLGNAFVFDSQNDTWPQQKQLLPPPPTNCGRVTPTDRPFPLTVIRQSSVPGVMTSDSAYVLQRNEGGPNNWGVVKLLIASDSFAHFHSDNTQYGDNFGISVSISGDTIVVGS